MVDVLIEAWLVAEAWLVVEAMITAVTAWLVVEAEAIISSAGSAWCWLSLLCCCLDSVGFET